MTATTEVTATTTIQAEPTTATVTVTTDPEIQTETVTVAGPTVTVTATSEVFGIVGGGEDRGDDDGESNVYYKNCTAAREAGAAPVRLGDPGYAKHLDRDGDGVGCEN